ncbi:MAG: ABC transporter substrate-binding protein [Dehalococcoidia bacterium]|jgi:peptide/nickel transport system substrate-binding protein|uniref:ABC transporter substrate-binding protein n=1 Tax=Candidatus Amarobacter glycogenicus TaxID=3140699 RepID=UPI001DB6653F|nr:ABC transporter substrate-binding protein [Dehalococcoidia bacterium]MBK7126209.1 ABC transporter substrate-binding protein [Dehalococcoidia bacterium]MBK7725670.1 ABC transporter substrate-binding protein [Dehalococcoidia bacterium]MBK8560343.1 ABC transporter substrate-binding protein [Dehalococcoidia bacterium]MBK9341919.1 ABC transporter substrate-binding protein [Dehalococcoidia bacterium]
MLDERSYWQRRLSRRTTLRGAGLASGALATAALVGCGDDDDDDDGGTPEATQALPTQDTTLKPVRGGSLTLVSGGEPRTLDVHFDTFPANTMITNNTNEGLLRFKADLTGLETELATAMPEQPDELTYVFKIPQGVKFQNVEPANGREFTSEDVKYSIERQSTDQAGKFQHAYFFLKRIASIETPDKYTVRVKMNTAYAPFLSYIASPWTMMINRESVEKWGDLTEHAIGTGPFIFKEWQKNVKVELDRNPDYRVKELPYVDKLTYLIATDAQVRATLYIDRKIDAIIVGYNELSQVNDKRKSDSAYRAVPSQFWRQFRMPPTLAADSAKGTAAKAYPKPYDDVRVREAVVRAIDSKQALDFVHSGDGVLANGPILPIYPLWALKDNYQQTDLKKAKELLSAAGMSGGHKDTLVWASQGSTVNDQTAEVLKQQLKEIGWDLTLQPMDTTPYYNKIYAWDYTLAHHVPLNNPDPDENLSAYFGRNSTFFKFHDEAIWEKIDKQAKTVNTPDRQALVQEIQKDIIAKHPMKFMYTPNNHNFVDKNVQGWFWPTDLYDGRKATAWKKA